MKLSGIPDPFKGLRLSSRLGFALTGILLPKDTPNVTPFAPSSAWTAAA